MHALRWYMLSLVVVVLDHATKWLASARLDSVSYTHLRAHETVLDLVCRLLLEKKKNSDKNTVLY